MNSGHCDGSSGSRQRTPTSCSYRNGRRRSAPLGSGSWWNAPARRQGYRSRSTPTGFDTLAATSSPTTGTTPDRYRRISATETSSPRCATASPAPPASTILGSEGAQMTDNITELRPKAKDPTNAQRQARYRKKRKPVVTATAISATPAITPPHPPPQKGVGRDIPAARNGGITLATLTAALALAMVSGGFSIYGMTSIFTGAPLAIVGMGVALELGKLSAVAWLGHQRGSASWGLKASLTMLVAVLMTPHALGCFGYPRTPPIPRARAPAFAVAGRLAR